MEGKLHKMVSGYILSLNGDIDDPYAIVNEELAKDYEWYKLSIKNCQSIERGYDLDELAENFWKEEFMKPGIIDTNSYKKGFQKCLELMNDDVFNWLEKKGYLSDDKDIIKKEYTQQTEWDVIVEMDCPKRGCDIECDIDCYEPNKVPKLDADGCLILKRI